MEKALIDTDPYTTNLTNKVLTGVKATFDANQCPNPLHGSGDVAVRFPANLSDGTNRNLPASICSYYGTDPKRQVSVVSHNQGDIKLKTTNVPSKEVSWITSVGQFHQGCPGGYNNYKFLRFAPFQYDKTSSPPIHSVFPARDSCPSYSKPFNPSYNINEHCGGADYRLCYQTDQSALDCCLGNAANCRPDQYPQSTFCDNFVSAYCRHNPTSPHCTCITPVPDDVNKKYKITAGQECWYSPCVDNIKAVDSTQKAYMTSAQIQKFNSRACPAINIVDCSQVNNRVFSSGMNFVNALNQECSIQGGMGTVIGADKPKSSGNMPLLLLGGGVAAVLLVVIFVVAITMD